MQRSCKFLLNFNPVPTRCCSGYVSRMRHLMKIKEDDEACREALKCGSFLLYHKLAPLLKKTNSGLYKLASLKTSDLEQILKKVGKDKHFVNEAVLLGCTDKGIPQFSLEMGDIDHSVLEQQCGGVFVNLRKAFFMLSGSDAPLVAKGQAVLRWHQTNGFCSATGQPTIRNQSGSLRICQSSGITYYPKMAPVVIVLVSDGSRCLLGRQSMFPAGMYSALAGFCDMGESVEEALHREVAEEVGLEVETLRYSGSQHWPFPQSSFMIACHATVNPDKTQVSIDKAELEDACWFTVEEVTEALQMKKPPRNPKGEPPVFWVPPSYAIANQLIQEWANQQQLKRQ
ncbi:nucleoside diphosphate-linked moiety X motif 13 isoform X1 [Myxocyprinus asiaticus]|uniref:nucleoside diphosphate-linked moiety X motif 13 isoform X1 n=2 Tax=Myxocyprinus asiaticus TaxID=70543 RepID=UPI0022225A41|nr:nucleoside diphosphate-linked moiety X motif 13 isoform X1 [Myxocyprinus asiaticus]XP_051530509.1 nucleoside diphosphate-linked moiety X motif 13 isoform X1 [Myxocyprinus asiaticus]XP_051530510.1 nucleoside diphosphate-linked moiety X motif 13 isoform X1 [Myxocyprinus asiaticus]